MDNRSLDEFTMQQMLGDDLLQDEKILWVGQPDPNVLFSRGDIFSLPFGLVWCAYMVPRAWDAFRAGHAPFPVGLLLFAVIAAVGLYMLVGRFICGWWWKQSTYYAVTNRRLLFVTKLRRRDLLAVSLGSIPAISKSIGHGGTGTLTFGNPTAASRLWTPGLSSAEAQHQPPAFRDISDADEVYQLVNRLIEEAKAPS